MKFVVFAFLSSLLIFAGAAFAQVPASAVQDVVKGYTLGPGDEITVKVLGETEYDFVAAVNENGKIEVPFAPDQPILAICRTENEIRTEVRERLAKYLKSPQVNLRISQRKSRPPVSVYGEVRNQQQYELLRRVNLIEILTISGGETDRSGGMVQIFRPNPPLCTDKNSEAIWKNDGDNALGMPSRMYSLRAARQGSEEANPEIFPGDIIVVQKASPVYVNGEVMHPGEFTLPDGGLPLMQAIAMASGLTREAKSKEISIIRRKTGSPTPEVIAVNYDLIRKGTQKDVMLQPFDIIQVGKAGKTVIQYLGEVLTGLPNRVPIPIR